MRNYGNKGLVVGERWLLLTVDDYRSPTAKRKAHSFCVKIGMMMMMLMMLLLLMMMMMMMTRMRRRRRMGITVITVILALVIETK